MFSTTTLLIIGTIILLYLFYDYVEKNELFKKKPRFFGPKALPILGNAMIIMQKNLAEVLIKIMETMETHKSPVRFWLGYQLWFIVHNADQIKEIMTNPNTVDKSKPYKFTASWVGNGLITAPASIWRVHRRLIQPSFNSNSLRSFSDIFQKQSELLTQKMAAELNGPEFDVAPYVSDYAMSVGLGSFVGLSQDEGDSKIFEQFYLSIHRILQIFLTRTVKVWLQSDLVYKFTKLSKEFEKSNRLVQKTIRDIIKKKRMELLETDQRNTRDEIEGKRKIFIDLLIEAGEKGQKFSDQDVQDEINTMIAAAVDTSSATLQFLMMVLACHPEVQDKIFQELCDIYGIKKLGNANIEYEDLMKMEYMERVIKETMRLFPIVPFIGREVKNDVKCGECILPQGSQVLIAICKIHRDEKYWPDPLKFDPDRFLPEEVAKRNPNCYMPFSSGSRICIGSSFAMLELKAALTSMLRAYVLKKDSIPAMEDVKLTWEVVIRPVEPITVKIVKRIPNIS